MSALRLLLPVRPGKINCELFSVINRLDGNVEVAVTLLLVISPDVFGSNQAARDEACAEATRELLRVERELLSQEIESRVSVRVGDFWQELADEAGKIDANVIWLGNDTLSTWDLSLREVRALRAGWPGVPSIAMSQYLDANGS